MCFGSEVMRSAVVTGYMSLSETETEVEAEVAVNVDAEIGSGRRSERVQEAPTNDDGEYVCARACKDGSPCLASVPLPGLSCYQHERDDRIVPL